MNYTDKMNSLIENGDIDGIEQVFNSGVVPIKVMLLNGRYETRWVDISNIHNEYYEDMNSDQQDYFIQNIEVNKKLWLAIFEHDLKVYEKNDLNCSWSEMPSKKDYKEIYG